MVKPFTLKKIGNEKTTFTRSMAFGGHQDGFQKIYSDLGKRS